MQLRRFVFGAMAALAVNGAQAQTVLSESFDNLSTLSGSGWVLTNQSLPVGSTGWYQGDAGVFAAQSGSADSYAAANYNNAAAGGTISNWLITPTFSTAIAGVVSFWAKADILSGFSDQMAYGLSSTGSANTADFVLGSNVTASGGWTQYSLSYSALGAGSVARFAVVYTGAADVSNYIGVDTLTVTAVPEPSTWLMLGVGVLGLAALRRRSGMPR